MFNIRIPGGSRKEYCSYVKVKVEERGRKFFDTILQSIDLGAMLWGGLAVDVVRCTGVQEGRRRMRGEGDWGWGVSIMKSCRLVSNRNECIERIWSGRGC